MNEVLDLDGKPLQVGDRVIVAADRDLFKGEIISFTDKTILLEMDSHIEGSTVKYSRRIFTSEAHKKIWKIG